MDTKPDGKIDIQIQFQKKDKERTKQTTACSEVQFSWKRWYPKVLQQ